MRNTRDIGSIFEAKPSPEIRWIFILSAIHVLHIKNTYDYENNGKIMMDECQWQSDPLNHLVYKSRKKHT